MGTLASVMAGSKIRTTAERFQAIVTGDIEAVEGVLKITRINVKYLLKAPTDQHAAARAALDAYLTRCPGAQSVIGCIDIRHEMILEDLPA